MTAKELTLNIAVNLGRLGRFSKEGRITRINQFITDTEIYLSKLEKVKRNEKFDKTYIQFKKRFTILKKNIQLNESWSEEMYTWATILTHRSRLLE